MIWGKSLNLGTFLAIWGQIVTTQVHRVVTYPAHHTKSRCARYVARCVERYSRKVDTVDTKKNIRYCCRQINRARAGGCVVLLAAALRSRL